MPLKPEATGSNPVGRANNNNFVGLLRSLDEALSAESLLVLSAFHSPPVRGGLISDFGALVSARVMMCECLELGSCASSLSVSALGARRYVDELNDMIRRAAQP